MDGAEGIANITLIVGMALIVLGPVFFVGGLNAPTDEEADILALIGLGGFVVGIITMAASIGVLSTIY